MKRASLVLLALTVSCGELADPDEPLLPGHEQANEPTPDTTPDTPVVAPAPPTVDAVPARWGYEVLPLRGRVQPFGVVLVEGGDGPIAGDADGSGRFCLEVPLAAGRQTLLVSAQNDVGMVSSPTRVEVEQDGSAVSPVQPERPVADRAAGRPVATDEEPIEGALATLTDGDGTSFVTLPTSVVWVDLGAVFDVEAIELWFPDHAGEGDGTYAVSYDVLFSALGAPALPAADDADGWSLLTSVNGADGALGEGGVDELLLDAPVRARFVAVALWENDAYEWPFTPERMRVSELKVMGRPLEAVVPRPSAPSCTAPAAP